MVSAMLEGIEVRLGIDFLKDRDSLKSMAKCIVYTGAIDEYYDYCFGELQYRSLRFETEVLDIDNYQGVAGMNFTDAKTPYTRIVEHKHFEFGKGNRGKTVITKEYPQTWKRGFEAYYPVNDDYNMKIYNHYEELSRKEHNTIFAGRLGKYRYMDMDKVIAAAIRDVKIIRNGEDA